IGREFAWTDRTARNYMMVYQAFKTETISDLEPIDVRALYLIASPATPEPVRQEAIRQAAIGPVTHATVKAVVAEYQKTGDGEEAARKLFGAIRAAQAQEAQGRKLLPSPAEARRTAIETGAHTLDRNGAYQPPMTVENQQAWRADLHRLGPLQDFVRWVAGVGNAAGIVKIINRRYWRDEFDPREAMRAAAWLTDFAKELECRSEKRQTSAN
ncbi:MAG TPA: hypothetical protein VI455_04150, partial [Terriglobia bacterium]